MKKALLVVCIVGAVLLAGCSERIEKIRENAQKPQLIYKGQTYDISENDIIYFANGELQHADWVNEVIILVKGDHHFYDADFSKIVVFENNRPMYFDFPEKTGIFIIWKENGDFSGDSYDYYDTILIQNGKLYKFEAKVKEIVLENGERYRLK